MVRDGRGFSHRQVDASQDGRSVFRLLASFQRPVEGPDHDDPIAVAVDATGAPADAVDYHAWEAAGTDNPGHDALTAPGPVEDALRERPGAGLRPGGAGAPGALEPHRRRRAERLAPARTRPCWLG